MGLLIDGIWHSKEPKTDSADGKFKRKDATFRNWVTSDGAPGPTGTGGFKAEADRYHLYISYACPWAHRALIMRALKGLEDIISLSVVDHLMRDKGWEFSHRAGAIPDPIFNAKTLSEIYVKADPTFTGRVTVPVLWDKKTATIVSNESSEIIRMFNSAFQDFTDNDTDFYPTELRSDINAINDRIYHTVNNGVYKAGFATTQAAYNEAVQELFNTLDYLEERLAAQPYLTGDTITEADWRLFPTLIRFDPVYVGHFKCNIRCIVDYTNLNRYLNELYRIPGVSKTVNMDHIKAHYYQSHLSINPTGIVPRGPDTNLTPLHG